MRAESSKTRQAVGRYRLILISIVPALLAVAVFWPVVGYEFVRYDDDRYVLDNPHVKEGLTGESVTWAFARPHYHMWHPVTTLSFLLDYELFGLNPAGYHLVNLLFHLANTLLLFWVLFRMTGAVWPSVFVAAVFAVHPLQVESIAWVAERKNVISGFFWLLTMLAYVRYAERPGVGRYLMVLAALCLGLMAKPIVVTLPFALLLLDYWPLDRIRWENDGKPPGRRSRYSVRRLIAEKIPMLAPAAAVAAVTFAVQKAGGAVPQHIPLGYRLANAFISYLTYLEKMIWPSRLVVFYPHPAGQFSRTALAISVPVLILISAYCIYAGRRWRYLPVGWLWYLGILVPVAGLIQAGAQARADRYMYITMIGPLVIIAWGWRDIATRGRVFKVAPAVVAIVLLSAAAVCTSRQLQYWRDGETLFGRAIEVTEDNFVMHNNYGNLLKKAGRTDEAMEHYAVCLQLRSDSPEVHNNLGIALVAKGDIDGAVEHYRRALTLLQSHSPGRYTARGLAETHHNLANALKRKKNFAEAAEHYIASLNLRPDNIDTLHGLGTTYAAMRRFDDAIDCYNRILELEPDNIIAHGLLGMALGEQGKFDEACEQFRIVLEHRPNDFEMHCNLGVVLQQQDRLKEAIEQYRRAVQIKPDYIKAQRLLQAALQMQKRPEQP